MSALDLEKRIKRLETTLGAYGQELRVALQYIQSDVASSLTKSRVVLEKLLVRVYIAEMGQEPRQPLLGNMLIDNQFTRHVERHPVLIVQPQNHSPSTVFGLRFQFERRDGQRIQPELDALEAPITNVDLAPGRSREWFVSGESLIGFFEESSIGRVLAIDEIDREYCSDPGERQTATILDSFRERVRRQLQRT